MKLLALTSALALAATGAIAGSYSSPPVEPPIAPIVSIPAYDWSGAYVGVHAGLPRGDNNWYFETSSSVPGNWDDTIGGLSLGYDMQRGSLVYGVALDVTSGITAVSTRSGGFGCSAGDNCVTEIGTGFALRGRLGYAMDRTLIYVTAGFASASVSANSLVPLTEISSDRLNGWVAGIGIEHALNRNWSLGAAYLHTDLGSLDIPSPCSGACATDASYGSFRLGVNYRF